ncbi:MAG: hypothetical protein ACRDZN_09535, partial [Acidimicrobiales bacterium]
MPRSDSGSPAALASPDVGVAHRSVAIGAGGTGRLPPALTGAGRALTAVGVAPLATRIDGGTLGVSAAYAAATLVGGRYSASTTPPVAGGPGVGIPWCGPSGGAFAGSV